MYRGGGEGSVGHGLGLDMYCGGKGSVGHGLGLGIYCGGGEDQ